MNQNDLILFLLFKNLFNQGESPLTESLSGQNTSSFLGDENNVMHLIQNLKQEVSGIQNKFQSYKKLWENQAQVNSGDPLKQEEFKRLSSRVDYLEQEIKKLGLVSQNGSANKLDHHLDLSKYEGRIEGVESQISALSLLMENTNQQLFQQNGQHENSKADLSIDVTEFEFFREKLQTLEHQVNSMSQVFDWTKEQIKNNLEADQVREEKQIQENQQMIQKISQVESQILTLDKVFAQLNTHYVKAFEELDNKKGQSSPEINTITDRLSDIEDKLKLHGDYINRITQKLFEQDKQPIKQVETNSIQVNKSQEFSPKDVHYVQHLNKMLFKNEDVLRAIFPNSFVIYEPKGDYPTSFFWAGEKMGLTYILIFRCVVSHSSYSFLPLLSNILTNTLVTDGKYMDTGSIMKAMNQELYDLFSHNSSQEDRIQAGITVIDQTNARMYFMGAQTDLLVNNSDFKVLEGDQIGLGQSSSEGQEFTRHDLNWSKNVKFYMIPSIQSRQKGIITRTNQLRYQDFEKQKAELINYIESSVEEEFIMLGFSPS